MFLSYYGSMLILIPGLILAAYAQYQVSSAYKTYSRVRTRNGLTGAEAARRLLDINGLSNVGIESIGGNLTDHYDPRTKVLRLSDATYNSTSVAAVGVAAHECGHAIQHATGYAPLKIRGALVPVANFGSTIAWPLILIGLLFSSQSSMLFLNLGIIAFSLAVLFQIVTLPVEFNASSRAIRILGSSGMLYEDEVDATKKVLSAAALTYVAGAASAILQLLRIILLANSRRD